MFCAILGNYNSIIEKKEKHFPIIPGPPSLLFDKKGVVVTHWEFIINTYWLKGFYPFSLKLQGKDLDLLNFLKTSAPPNIAFNAFLFSALFPMWVWKRKISIFVKVTREKYQSMWIFQSPLPTLSEKICSIKYLYKISIKRKPYFPKGYEGKTSDLGKFLKASPPPHPVILP